MRSRLAVTLLVALTGALAPALVNTQESAGAPSTSKVVVFSADGMRPDLMHRYAADGTMPAYADLLRRGVAGDNGLQEAFPPNTGVGWHTLATGAWPGTHGITNTTFHRTGEANFTNRAGADTAPLQADTLLQAAERAGRRIVSVEWGGSRSLVPGLAGPVIDFRNFFSTRGVLAFPLVAAEQAGAAAFGVSYQVAALAPAAGWTNTPAGDDAVSPPQQTVLTVATTFAAQNPTRSYDVYVYDSVVDGVSAYDRVLLARTGVAKNASQAAANLAAGDWADIRLVGADGLIGARAGQTAGFYVKLVNLSGGAGSVSSIKLYFTSVARAIATCACDPNFESTLVDRFPTSTASDAAPLQAGLIDEATYVEQGLKWADFHWPALTHILTTVQPDTDLLLMGTPVADDFSHQFLGLLTPTDMDGHPNPYFDDVTGDGVPDGRTAVRDGYLRAAYASADRTLALGRTLMAGATAFAVSGHGFAPQWRAVNVSKALSDLGYGPEQTSNCGAVAATLVKSCRAGATAQLYIDLAGRDPAGGNAPQVAAGDYATVRNHLVEYFTNLDDPDLPGHQQVVDAVFTKEQLRDVDGSDSLHPSRSGDLVVVFRPPYQADAATPGQIFGASNFFGQHGYLPDLVDLDASVNLHGVFVAAGPGIRHQGAVRGIRAVDLAPTVAFLMRFPGPQNAQGKVLFDVLTSPGRLREITLLNISDFHGQLVPLLEAADNLSAGGSSNPIFPIGGAAFLQPWFERFRAEAPNGSITVAGGDSVGATPPISSYFGDTPTIEAMNLMEFGADGLGNHNFDRGQDYLRRVLIPLADYPFLSANLVNSSGRTPPEWAPATVIHFGGVRVGLVGFSDPDLPSLVSPGALDPFLVADPLASVNATAARLKASGVSAVVALGHMGATGGTLSNPTGPLIDLADGVTNVDAVLGDHTDVQVLAVRPNGVLVTENLSRGVRMTRIRLVFDEVSRRVVYKTADIHRPWNIGVTPDASIQARLDDLTAELGPILARLIGGSTRFIPRADACGNGVGRTCESLVGNVVADAMRSAYGTDFALTNSGGLRASLTCPVVDDPGDFCPPYTPPPYAITPGQVLSVLPFGNVAVTLSVSGAELKTMLENGVSLMPAANGRFPQVSGLCVTYDISAPAGSRVTGAVRQAAGGSCTGPAIDLTAGSTYFIAENDFMAEGGDGYPNFTSRATTRGFLDQTVVDYVQANTPISPVIQGRIACTTSGATPCPVVVP